MPFIINPRMGSMEEFGQLKALGDGMLEEAGLGNFSVEIRPATDLEEKAVAGEGLAPVADTGFNYAADEQKMVIYRTENSDNPLLENVTTDPEGTAKRIVAELVEMAKKNN